MFWDQQVHSLITTSSLKILKWSGVTIDNPLFVFGKVYLFRGPTLPLSNVMFVGAFVGAPVHVDVGAADPTPCDGARSSTADRWIPPTTRNCSLLVASLLLVERPGAPSSFLLRKARSPQKLLVT